MVLGAVGVDECPGSDASVEAECVRDSGASLVLDAAVAGSAPNAGRVAEDN